MIVLRLPVHCIDHCIDFTCWHDIRHAGELWALTDDPDPSSLLRFDLQDEVQGHAVDAGKVALTGGNLGIEQRAGGHFSNTFMLLDCSAEHRKNDLFLSIFTLSVMERSYVVGSSYLEEAGHVSSSCDLHDGVENLRAQCLRGEEVTRAGGLIVHRHSLDNDQSDDVKFKRDSAYITVYYQCRSVIAS